MPPLSPPAAPLPPAGPHPHRIRQEPAGRGGAFLHDSELVVTGAAEFLRRRTHDFLRREASRRLGFPVLLTAALPGAQARRVTVKDTKSRWGSCASDGSLS